MAALGSASLLAQDAPDEEDEVFVMPEFRVDASQDVGYRATNAISGTLLNTRLRDSPFAIDVFTNELIDDTGSTDFREILEYDSGVQLENTLAISDGDNFTTNVENDPRAIYNNETDIVVRGFRAPTLKNGFFTQTRVDTANIDRLERAGGPVSLLYGIGAISGITNVLTKRPLPESYYRFEAFTGSDDFRRFSFDVNGPPLEPFGGFLGYRLNGAWQSEESAWEAGREEELLFLAPVIEWAPFTKTNIRVEFEFGDRTTRGLGPIVDEVRFLADGENRTEVLDDGLEYDVRQIGFVPAGLNIGGPDHKREEDLAGTFMELTQQIGDHLTILASANYEDYEREERIFNDPLELYRVSGRDQRRWPEERLALVRPVTVGGIERDRILRYSWADTLQQRHTWQARVSVLYSRELFGGVQNLVVGRQELSEDTYTFEPDLSDDFSYAAPDGSPVRYAGETIPGFQYKDHRERWYQGHYVVYQGNFLDDRFMPVLGYRWDRVNTRWRRSFYNEDGSIRETVGLPTRPTVSDGYDNNGNPIRSDTPTAGFSIRLSDALSVYGTYAEGTGLPNTAQRDGDDEAFPPEFTRSREFGVKFDFFEGKLSGRVTGFKLEKFGGVRFNWYSPSNRSDPIWNTEDPVTYDLTQFPTEVLSEMGIFDRATELGIEEPFLYFNESLPPPAEQWTRLHAVPWSQYGDLIYNWIMAELDKWDAGGSANANERLIRELVQTEWRQYNRGVTPWNNPQLARGAYNNYNETSDGIEVRLNLSPMPNWQTVVSYTFNEVKVSSGAADLSSVPYNEEAAFVEPVGESYNYMAFHATMFALGRDNFGDLTDTSSYLGGLDEGAQNNDTPKHSFSLWSKYSFTEGLLEGFDIRGGLRYTGERVSQSPWEKGWDNEVEGRGDNVAPKTPAFTVYDLGFGYEKEMWDIVWGLNVNVRNIFDEGTVEASKILNADSPTPFPVLTRYYIEPRTFRVSLRATF